MMPGRFEGCCLVVLTIALTCQHVCVAVNTVQTSFSGKEYIEYTIPEGNTDNRKDKVTLKFKTIEAYGILLYSCGQEGDFLLLEIKRGKLIYTGSFGSVEENDGTHQIILDLVYNDNKWHTATLLREAGSIHLTVDNETKSKSPKGDFMQLNLDTSFFVGGIGERQRLDTTCLPSVGKKNFIGCMEDVHFNSINLLYGANEMFNGYKIHGANKLPSQCQTEDYEIIGLPTKQSSLHIKRDILTKNELRVYVEVRTFEPEGHIFTHKSTDGAAVLDLVDGKIRLTLSFLMLAENDAVPLKSDVIINDGDWHRVEVVIRRNESQIALTVDGDNKLYQFKSHFKLSTEFGLFSSLIRFGGNTPNLPGLVNCYRKIKVDGKLISVKSGVHVQAKNLVTDICQIKDACFPSPCQHGSVCSQLHGAYTCDCKNTGYGGPRCESCTYKRTCEEIRASGETKSGVYKICPKNENIFNVFCNMVTGTTVIKHNLDNDTQVGKGRLEGTSRQRFYFHDVNYFTGLNNIVDLMNVSLTCSQYIRYDCYQSVLLRDVGLLKHSHFKGARWTARDSVIQQYWGGATPKSQKCGCAMDGTCAKDALGRRKSCNCDVFDNKWRFDAGFLSDKSRLPVLQLQFSKGPETNKNSFFTVGQLKCHGTVPKPTDIPTSPPASTTRLLVINPTLIDGKMFINTSRGLLPYENQTLLVLPVQNAAITSLFSKPWLVTIIIIGTILCLLLVFMVFLLFRQNIYDVMMKCVYGNHVTKPRVEIEDYNRYSTATEEESDWDIYRLSTTFPTSTPEPSYGPTDDESVGMRVRTLEDLRGKRRFKRLTGWGSRTASAPTVVGSLSKYSIDENDESLCLQNPESKRALSECETKISEKYNTYESVESERAYSTTATDGECDSVLDDSVSEFSHKSSHHSHDSSMKESECSSTTPVQSIASNGNHSPPTNQSGEPVERPYRLSYNNDSYTKRPNAVPLPPKLNGSKVCASEPVKAYYPVLPYNGFRQPAIRRAHPVEYGSHMTVVNNNGNRCPRFVAVNRRPAGGTEAYTNMIKHPPIQERDELSDEELQAAYENQRNSDGFYELYDHGENASPSSETRLLFDDTSSREECMREADEQIKLLKKKVIEKATSADECTG